MTRRTAVIVFALAAGCEAGCGGSVDAVSAGSTSGSGAGGADARPMATSGAGGAGPTPACPDPSVFFDMIGDGLMLHFTASCGPIGRVVLDGSVPPSSTLDIASCDIPEGGHQILVFAHADQWPATIDNGSIRYARDSSSWAGTGPVTISSIGPIGGVIEGDYSGTLVRDLGSAPPDQVMISGKFKVCHGPDEPGGK